LKTLFTSLGDLKSLREIKTPICLNPNIRFVRFNCMLSKRKFLFIFLGLSLIWSVPDRKAYSQIQDITRDGVSVRIPFSQYGDFIIVRGRFFGTVDLNFIFDTGAENTILFEKLLTDLMGVEYDRRIPLYGSDLSEELFALIVRNIHLELPPAKRKNMSILVLEEDYTSIRQFLGVEIHGILGASYFGEYIVEINYRRQYIELHRSEAFKGPGRNFDTYPVGMINRKPYIRANYITPTNDTLYLDFLMDTGAALPLLVHTNTHDQLSVPENVIVGNLGSGLGGYLVGYVGRSKNFELWGQQFPDILTSYQDLDSLIRDFQFLNRQGIIGNKLLSRFHLFINYPKEEVYVRPYRRVDRPFRFDRSGLNTIASGPRLNTFYIIHVVENSPADDVGLRRGDRILSFQRRPVSWLNLARINRTLSRKEGKNIRIRIERDEEVKLFTFQLRELF